MPAFWLNETASFDEGTRALLKGQLQTAEKLVFRGGDSEQHWNNKYRKNTGIVSLVLGAGLIAVIVFIVWKERREVCSGFRKV